jgi:threonine efflux protein
MSLWQNKSSIVQVDGSPENTLVAAYIRGLLTNLSNPKSVVYFGSIFALFMRPGIPVWVQFVAVSIVLFDTVLWYGTVAIMFSNRVVRQLYTRIQRPIDRITSCVMIGFGVKLMLTPKNAS